MNLMPLPIGGRAVTDPGFSMADYLHGCSQPISALGRHYCVEDWHVIVVAMITGGDRSFSEQDAIADLSQFMLAFTLDGAELPTDRGPVKRFLDPAPFGFEGAYFFQRGALLSPSELSVGSHSVSYTEDGPLGHHEDGITIFIDPAGEDGCL